MLVTFMGIFVSLGEVVGKFYVGEYDNNIKRYFGECY